MAANGTSSISHSSPGVNANALTPSPSYSPPSADIGGSITQNGFTISTQKMPILKAEPIAYMSKKLGIAPPEMIFGDNLMVIEHESGWGIQFNAWDALDRVDKTGGSMLQVAHSKEWQSTRYAGDYAIGVWRYAEGR